MGDVRRKAHVDRSVACCSAALLGTVGVSLLCVVLSLVSGIAEGRTNPSTPVDAGREWFTPKDAVGRPDRSIPDYAGILAEHEVAPGKRIVLYAWRGSSTASPLALSVVPLGIKENRTRLLPWHPRVGWHPAGVAGPRGTLPSGDGFVAGSLPAGFAGLEEGVATAWGLSARDGRTRVTWSDGVVTEAPLRGGAFLQVRPDPNYPQHLDQRLSVRRTELLDEQGTVLAAHDLAGSVLPDVRGP